MGVVIRKYDCSLNINDDNYIGSEFDLTVYDELLDLCGDHDNIVLLLKNSKFIFNFNLGSGSLNIDYEGSKVDYQLVQRYFIETDNKFIFLFYQLMASLIEGISMIHSPITAYFCDTEEESKSVYEGICIFKTKAEYEKEKSKNPKNLNKPLQLVYIPNSEYHEHQFINFCKKYNLDISDWTLRSTTFEEYCDRSVYFSEDDFSVSLPDLYDFLDGIDKKEDIVEARYGATHIFIYRFFPEKYSKLILLNSK